ncbi:MAG TPA: hypothetical protein VLA21_10740 [Candidatus Limnocylindria bacterium]|nr:hypothetical protein [Candidatus Limnocylindria bacterium]
MKNRLAALTAALLLLLALPAAGAGEAFKDEVVYALLSASGDVKAVYVVNSFESASPQEVADYGEYTDVLPLARAEGFAYRDGKAEFRMDAGRFEYQGTPSGLDLPWRVSIEYALDGAAVPPEELAGKSGFMEGRIVITPDERFAGVTGSLTLQVSVTLPAEHALDIRADKATVAVSGGDRSLSFVLLPGRAAEYAFSAQVRDFRMPGIQVAGVRMAMDTEMYQAAAREALAGTLLETAAGGLLGGFLQQMQGRPPVSFADPRNAVRSVQFVLMGEAIEKPAPARTPEPEAPQETFWDRILRLF